MTEKERKKKTMKLIIVLRNTGENERREEGEKGGVTKKIKK